MKDEMINEQRYWKRDLTRIAAELQRCQAQRYWRVDSYAKFEKLLMLGFYTARKLIESKWVNSNLKNEPVVATAYPCFDLRMYPGASPQIEERYDLRKPSPRRLPLQFICNQIVHSFAFTPAFRNRRLVAVYVSSYEKRDHLFRIELPELVRVLQKTAQSRHHILVRFATEVNRYDEL